jgi:hypothetical protein
VAEDTIVRSKGRKPNPDDEEAYPLYANDADPWKAHFAEIDALLDRTNQVLAGETPLRKSRSHLVYDPDQDEAEAEDLWLEVWSCFGKMESTLIAQEDLHAPHTLYERVSG